MKTYSFMNKGTRYIQAVSRLVAGICTNQVHHPHGITYTDTSGKPLFTLIDNPLELIVDFYVPIPTFHKNNPIEHIGSQQGLPSAYRLRATNIDQVYAAIEIALVNKQYH